jgi:hypothetical protein
MAQGLRHRVQGKNNKRKLTLSLCLAPYALCLKPRPEKGELMDEKYLRLLETVKALVKHIDTEHVFDKGVQTGRGAFDTSRSEEFDDLVEKAREAVRKAEDGINT